MTADIPETIKSWAETIQIPENVSRGTDLNADYIVNSHPAVLDGFVNMFRKAGQEMNREPEMEQNDTQELSGQENRTCISGGRPIFVYPGYRRRL